MSDTAKSGAAYLAQRRAEGCEGCFVGTPTCKPFDELDYHDCGNRQYERCTAPPPSQVIGELLAERTETATSAFNWMRRANACEPALAETRERLNTREFLLDRNEAALVEARERIAALEAQLAEAREDGERLSLLQERDVDTIYMDDGQIIDVQSGNLRNAIDKYAARGQ